MSKPAASKASITRTLRATGRRVTARCQRPDKTPSSSGCSHADAVAEDGAAGDGLEGSTAMTATVFPAARSSRMTAFTSVDLPAPGGPVKPATRA